MNIVLLESLAIDEKILNKYKSALESQGHKFFAYERTDDIEKQKQYVKDADILIIANMPLCAEVIKSAKNLKFIDIAFTGVDHVDLEAAKACQIAVSNASGYSNDAVAELTLGMILTLLRNVPQADKRTREGGTKEGPGLNLVGNELRGKTVGIIGCGAIGSTTARLCRAFGCKILAYNGFSNKQSTSEITYMPLKDLLQTADIVTLHCPVSEKSQNLINKETLSYMKNTAILINTARGAVVNSKDLADALNKGQIRAAGIDVFETEPPLAPSHPLLNCKNILLTPHVAFATKESMEKRVEIVFHNIECFLNNNQINKII